MHCLFLFPGFSTSGLRHFICQVTGSEHIPGYKKKHTNIDTSVCD